jgi:transcription elongation GreA/GreB family factor
VWTWGCRDIATAGIRNVATFRIGQRVHFGATVTTGNDVGEEREVTIVGVDELDAGTARLS